MPAHTRLQDSSFWSIDGLGQCGSKGHATGDCPHDCGTFGLGALAECSYCGRNNHWSDACPPDCGITVESRASEGRLRAHTVEARITRRMNARTTTASWV